MATIPDKFVVDLSGGIRNDRSDYQKDENEVVNILNCDIDERGRVKKRRGSHQLGDPFTFGTTGDNIFGKWIDNSVYFEITVLGTGVTKFHFINDNTGNSSCTIYEIKGTRLATVVATADTTIDVVDASVLANTGADTIEIEGDMISYTGVSTNTLTGVTNITSPHVVDSAVNQLSLVNDSTTPEGRLGVYYAYLNNQLVINGYLGSSVFDGTTVTEITDDNEAAGIFATTYHQRIFVAGSGAADGADTRNGKRDRIAFSEPGDPSDWGDYTVNFVDVEDSRGEEITGLKVSTSDELLIFKTNSMFAYNEVSLRQRSNTVGAYNHRVVQQIDNLFYTFCPAGIFVTNGSSSRKISEPVKDYLKDFFPVKETQLSRVVINTFAAVFDRKYILYIGDTTGELANEDVLLVYDTQLNNWTVYQGFTNFMHLIGLQSFKYGGGVNKIEGLFGGDSAGKYFRFFSKKFQDGDNEQNSHFTSNGDLFTDLVSNTGVPVSSTIQTKLYDLKDPRLFKQFRYLRVLAEGTGFSVSYQVENEKGISDWMPLGTTTATNQVFEFPRKIARGFRIRFRFAHADANSAPALNGFVIEKTEELSEIRKVKL